VSAVVTALVTGVVDATMSVRAGEATTIQSLRVVCAIETRSFTTVV
jgi:hypothetical protein